MLSAPFLPLTPYTVISLWEMETFLASRYLNLVMAMERAFQIAKQREANLGDFRRSIEIVSTEAEFLGLKISANEAKGLLRDIKYRSPDVILETQVASLNERIRRELNEIKFVHIKGDRLQFLNGAELFGQEVASSFPSARYDIEEAGSCFAIGCYTACVFHLMRSMETPIQVLSKKIGLEYGDSSWGPAIGKIESRVKEFNALPQRLRPPGWKANGQRFSEAAASLDHLRVAWRNYVMHRRVQYGSEQALKVWNHTKDLMQHLSTWLREDDGRGSMDP